MNVIVLGYLVGLQRFLILLLYNFCVLVEVFVWTGLLEHFFVPAFVGDPMPVFESAWIENPTRRLSETAEKSTYGAV